MSRLVIGYGSLLFGGYDLVLALETADDTVDGGEKVLTLDAALVVACGYEGRLVAYVCYVCAREPGCLLGEERTVEMRVEFQVAQVYVEYLLALLDIGQADLDLTVETPGTHQCLVEYVGTVGRGENDDTRICLEAVHLGQQLVEGILTFVVTRESGILAAGASYGVNLVDEDDAGSLLLGLLEEVTHARSAHADEHLDEIRSRYREERYVCLTGNGLCKKGLSRTRGAYQKRSLGDLGSQLTVFVGLLEEVDYLHDLDLGLLQTCNILEGDAFVGVVLVEDLSAGLAYVHDASAGAPSAARHAAYEEDVDADKEYPRQQVEHDVTPARTFVGIFKPYGVVRDGGFGYGIVDVAVEYVDRTYGEGKLFALSRHALVALVVALAVLFDGLGRKVYEGRVLVHHLYTLHFAVADHVRDGVPVAGDGLRVAAREERVSYYDHHHRGPYPHEVGPDGFDVASFVVVGICHDYNSYSYFLIGASAHSSSSL